MLAKSWFINNIKYTQDWQRGQSNKSSTSFGVMKSHREVRLAMLRNLAEGRSTVLSSSARLRTWLLILMFRTTFRVSVSIFSFIIMFLAF